MILAILITGCLFIAMAYILTESNAKYLLSGYNTMNEEEQKNFDLKRFLPFFKSFHIVLGITTIMVGLILKFLISDFASGLLLAIYPVLAYIYFLQKSNTFYKGKSPITSRIGIVVLCVILVFITIKLLTN
ncbi:DUF3784 domain-containing protein [Litoribaculum gwangyangense]|uniref:DUF3784 domain-containing protein n=1 Tax=Litoribaculum gwangyangense TaxID=1130722 RepID=A0ABP9CS12_9FLAO